MRTIIRTSVLCLLLTTSAVLLASAATASVRLSQEVGLFDDEVHTTSVVHVEKDVSLSETLVLKLNPELRWDDGFLVTPNFDIEGGVDFLNRRRTRRGIIGGAYGLSYLQTQWTLFLGVDPIHMGNSFEFVPINRLSPKDYLVLPFPRDQETLHGALTYYLNDRASLKAYFLPVDNVSYIPVEMQGEDWTYSLVSVPRGLQVKKVPPALTVGNFQGALELDWGNFSLVAGRALENLPRVDLQLRRRVAKLRYDPTVFGGGWYSYLRGPLTFRLNAVYVGSEGSQEPDRVESVVQVDYQVAQGLLLVAQYLSQESLGTTPRTPLDLKTILNRSVFVHAEYNYRGFAYARLGALWRAEPGDGLVRWVVGVKPRNNLTIELKSAVFYGPRTELLGQFRDTPLLQLTVSYSLFFL